MARLTFNTVKVELEKYEITVEKTTKGYDCICQGFRVPQKTLKDCLQYRDNLLDGSTCDLPLPTVNEIKVNEIKTCHFPSISDAIKHVASFGAVLTGSISSNERSQYEYSINGTVVLICKENNEPDYWVHVKELTFGEIKEYALSCGYTLTELKNEYCDFKLCSHSGRSGYFTTLADVLLTVKEGRLLNKEYNPLPFSMTFDEVKAKVLNAGYTKFNGWHRGFLLGAAAKEKYYNTLADVMDAVKSGELLQADNDICDLPAIKDDAIANSKNKEIDKGRKINLKIDGKMVAVNPDDHNLKLTWDPIFGWQLVGVDSQELIREPLNPQTKEQPSLKFKTKESAIRFAEKLMAKIKNIKEDRVREYKQRAIKEFMVKVNNA